MTEAERLADEKNRALQPYVSGAVVQTEYLQRRQEYVAVNRHDLDDLKTFDALEMWLFTTGMFFMSGATWLGIDKFYDTAHSGRAALLIACCLSVAFGAVLCVVGFVMRRKKRQRIDRIFSESGPLVRP